MAVTYFITGANKGIGFALAKKISENPENKIIATTRSFKNATGLKGLKRENIHVIELDLTSPLDKIVANLPSQVDHFAPNGIDVIIQNGGANHKGDKSILDSAIDGWEEHFQINTIGPVKLYKALFPYWSASANPASPKKFIFVNSVVGLVNNYFPTPSSYYGSSKAALAHVARHIAYDLSQSEVDHIAKSIIVSVHPGLVDTELTRNIVGDDPSSIDLEFITPEQSANQLEDVISKLELKDNDTFIYYDGTRVSW